MGIKTKKWKWASTNHIFPSVLFAMLINVVLFGLMPGLVRTVPDKPEFEDSHHFVQVIRIKRPETSVTKKEKKKPPKPEKKELRSLEERLSMPKPIQKKIRLPFELNTKLPAGPQTLSMPGIDMLSLNAPDFRDAYDINEIDGVLTPLAKIPPIYPMRAKRLSIEGSVRVRFLVNEEGTIEDIEVIEADPPDVFETSVFNCVSKWRFKPGTIEGIPVKTWAETVVRFELEN